MREPGNGVLVMRLVRSAVSTVSEVLATAGLCRFRWVPAWRAQALVKKGTQEPKSVVPYAGCQHDVGPIRFSGSHFLKSDLSPINFGHPDKLIHCKHSGLNALKTMPLAVKLPYHARRQPAHASCMQATRTADVKLDIGR